MLRLKALLKAKANEKKELKELIDEFIKSNAKANYKNLEEFLEALIVFIYQKWDSVEKNILLELVKDKIKEYSVNFNTDDIDTIYEKIATAATISTATLLNVKPKFTFDKVDVKAIKHLRDMFYWTGTQHSLDTQEKLKSIIEDVFKGNIPRAEVAGVLEEQFSGILSADRFYFEGVADHIINQSQNVARVTQALKYNIKAFRVVARIDNKTSDICRSMHGRIISATHLKAQVDKLLNAKNMSEKKAAAIWLNKPHFGALPKDLGLPPYHFRCRTIIVPVTLFSQKIDGKKVVYANKNKDDIITHIDKSGLQRRVKQNIYNKLKYKHKLKGKEIIGVLNDLKYIAPKKGKESRFLAMSSRGYVVAFDADEVVTIFKPSRKATEYFNDDVKDGSIVDIDSGKILERVKKWFEIL